MDVLTDYVNWKIEKSNLLHSLLESDSIIIERYRNTIRVLDYLYNLVVEEKQELSTDEEYIFSIGFDYLDSNFLTIEDIARECFDDNLVEMEKCSKTINLYLYAVDIEDEITYQAKNQDIRITNESLEELDKFINELYDYMKQKKNVAEAMFVKFDELTTKICQKYRLDIEPIDSIFFEIAETYGLIKVDNDVYNNVINEMIDHDKTSHSE